MAVKFLSLKRAKRLKFLLFAVVIIVVGMIVYFPDYSRLKILRQERQVLQERIGDLETEITEYQNKIRRLEEDHSIFERIARDRLGVIRKDEIIVDIEE